MRLALLVCAAHALLAQPGPELYRVHCSVPYCHGPAGTAGRGPALAGRGYDRAVLRSIIAKGIPSRGMPAFETKLGQDELDRVVAYVMALPNPSPAASASKPAAAPPAPRLSREAAAGRELFFDSARMPGCSACHAVAGMGAAIGPALTGDNVGKVPAATTARVQTAFIEGEAPFPALVVESAAGLVRLYDFGARLPVLRTLIRSDVRLEPGSSWHHSAAAARYTEAELRSIAGYVRSVAPAR